jgi:hypothetical protein
MKISFRYQRGFQRFGHKNILLRNYTAQWLLSFVV